MTSNPSSSQGNKTHQALYFGLDEAIQELKQKFTAKNCFSHITLEEVDFILEDFSRFPLGRHILLSGGSNGMWTDYLISPQEHLKSKNHTELDLSVIERFFLFNSPAVLAQRELHKKLQKTAQKCVADGKVLASLPCGLMRDLLSLDYSQVSNVSLIGLDIDPDSIEKSKALASSMKIANAQWIQQNAWDLNYNNAFDFISSIGLNMYENKKERVVDLYNKLFNALKPGGILFTGILTYPPYLNEKKSDWDVSSIPKFDMHLETVIHRDILNIQWFNFRTLAEAKDDFREAGFTNIQIEPDSRCIFPAIIAVK